MDSSALLKQFMNSISFSAFATSYERMTTVSSKTGINDVLQTELVDRSCVPGKATYGYSLQWSRLEKSIGQSMCTVSILNVTPQRLYSEEDIPKTIVNRDVVDNCTPNLFFRFRGRLFGVFCPLHFTCRELCTEIWRVEKRTCCDE